MSISFDRNKVRSSVNGLSKLLIKCLNRIEFKKAIFYRKDLQHIFNNSLQWKSLIFTDCKLVYEEIVITSKAQSNIRWLGFQKWGIEENCNWREHPDRFKNLMKAISESGVKRSLAFLLLEKWGINKKFYNPVLVSWGMAYVIVKT